MHAVDLEFRKTFTTNTWWILALLAVVLVAALSSVIAVNVLGGDGGEASDDTMLKYTYSFAARTAYVFPFLFGALLITNEYRHRTLGRSLLLAGSRGRLYGAKIAVTTVYCLALGAVCASLNGGAVAAVLRAQDLDPALGDPDVRGVLVRTVAVFVLWGLLGLGLGALVRNQVATVVVVLAFTVFIEPTLTSLANENVDVNTIGRYLPGAASMSLAWPPEGSVSRGEGSAASLGWLAGGLVLAAYAMVLVVVGYLARIRARDITE